MHPATAHDCIKAFRSCTNRPVIRLNDSHLCRDCYAAYDFGDDA